MDNLVRQNFVNLCVSHLGVGSYLELGTTSAVNAEGFAALGIPMCGVSLSSSYVSALRSKQSIVAASPTFLPFHSEAFDFVVSEALPSSLGQDLLRGLFLETRRVARRGALISFDISPELNRAALETLAFECGFRRHAGLLRLIPYENLQVESGKIVLFLETVPNAVAQQWSLADLARERELHMDMSRESGSRSDAHLIRYHRAATLVRPGDVVLDAACGLGYGSWIMASSAARRVVAIDHSQWAVDYASVAFQTSKLTFQVGELPACLNEFHPGEFDLIVSFETLEHLADPAAFLGACARILAPAGRIIVSVPNDWADDTGRDPNPHHFDVYDWPKLKMLLQERFLLENAFAQTADRAKVGGKWTPQNRGWTAFDPDSNTSTVPAEWLVAVGMKHFRGADLPPWSREWQAGGHPVTPPPVDYVHMLENPWLSRALLDRGSRLDNPRLLMRECETILEAGGPFDRAAALVVLCYRDLEDQDRTKTRQLIDAVVRWRREVPGADERYAVRWHVSLTFVAARLALKLGSLHEAETWFENCIAIDAGLFGPLLLTKTVEACYRLGILRAADGRRKTAMEAWNNGLRQAERVLSMPAPDHFGADGTRLPFVLKEISQVCQWGQACADALEAPILHDLGGRTLFSNLLICPATPISSPDPSRGQECWKILQICNANQWCRKISTREFILHPNGFDLRDQPSLHVEVNVERDAFYLIFSAEAYDEDCRNGGVLLFAGPDECADADLRCWHLPPRELAVVTYPIEKPFEGTHRLRIVVGPVPNAPSSNYLAVRLKWIGAG
ncbi:class I SAM-dependent methyltransferase [Methylobacterium sp. DCY52]|uniref:class I SAM-dependent methyltransferase n=1 Tax=Methylobacterium sp. DCY52 TaxID=739139 RepID=UPI0031452161